MAPGFHVYNVLKRPGGLVWQNLFYGAPIGAPMAILLSGLLGDCVGAGCATIRGGTPKVFGLPAGRALAALSGAGLLGTAGEAGLLHFRGAYHNPFMYAPVTIPPVAAGLLRHGRGRDFGTHSLADPLVAAADGAARLRRRRLSRLRGVAEHGRLAQLAPDRPEWPAIACAAQLHRSRAGRPRALWACWRTTPMPDRFPGYDVLSKR